MMKESKTSTRQLTLTALFMALTTVATMVIHIPVPATQGFVNVGDSFVLLSGLLFSHYYGALIGGVGSALADLFLGYTIFAPVTLIVKAIEALLASYIDRGNTVSRVIAVIVGVTWMVFGYFIFEVFMFDLPVALSAVIPNSIQGIVSAGLALLLYPIVRRLIDR
ncbi:ECF transporter S component [Dolosigranulum pigrum]|nr:ECF transporter S component [Dolosigranulum pigrum]QTJ46216.1 ECF transporter S component [Dolosigranulum pigrum]QTJ59734.1 ECF transporter S component [Dolosigranulum pigrum]